MNNNCNISLFFMYFIHCFSDAKWHNCVLQYTRINPGCTTSYKEYWQNHRFIYFRYENHTCNSFSYEFSTSKVGTSIILKESHDRSQIQMHCTSDGGTRFCPNYGKFLRASVLLYTIQPKVCAPLTFTPICAFWVSHSRFIFPLLL